MAAQFAAQSVLFAPESDEDSLVRRRIRAAELLFLAGDLERSLDHLKPLEVGRLATADLSGDVVTEAVSRGKHLLVRTGNGMTVHTHLRMDGSWRVRPAAERVRESHRIRLMLANYQWRAIGYQLGVVELDDREASLLP